MRVLIRFLVVCSLLVPVQTWAAVASVGFSESHTGAAGSASEASFTWNHTPSATPRGVIVFTCGLSSATNDVTSVTYGGVNVPAVTGGAAADTVGEPGNIKAWFLGSGIPDGLQAVVVNRNNNANVLYASLGTVSALSDTAVHEAGIVLLQENGTLAEQSVDDGSPGTDSLRYAAGFTGLDNPGTVVAGANTTAQQSIDTGVLGCVQGRETTAGQGARSVGYSDGAADDRGFVHLAIKETGAGAVLQPGGVNVIGAGL